MTDKRRLNTYSDGSEKKNGFFKLIEHDARIIFKRYRVQESSKSDFIFLFLVLIFIYFF